MTRDEDFLDLAEQVTSGIYRRALLITRDPHLAEDLTQETLTRLYVNFRRLRHDENPRGYAFTTLYRLAIDRSRRRSSTEVPIGSLPENQSPERQDDLRLDLERALADLSPEMRALVVARYIDDIPDRQVAQMLNRTESWVRTNSSRALARLRTSPALADVHH